jgi:hypothetical protein
MLTVEQKKYVKEHFATKNTVEIAEFLQVPTREVSKYASNSRLKKSSKSLYQKKSICQASSELILQNYHDCDLNWLSEQTGQSVHAIQEWARKRGLKRTVNLNRKGDLSALFSETLESYYWLGFIAADGYVYKNGHFMISQSVKDKSLIFKLSKYLKTSVYKYISKKGGYRKNDSTTYRINICDKNLGIKLREMFNIQNDSPKTYTGISLDFIKNSKQAAAFLCGFIDGDGSLNKSKCYKIECHKSWFTTLSILMNKCPKKFHDFDLSIKKCKSKKSAYAVLRLRIKSSTMIRKFAKKFKLPCSSRKFDLSKTNYQPIQTSLGHFLTV